MMMDDTIQNNETIIDCIVSFKKYKITKVQWNTFIVSSDFMKGGSLDEYSAV